MEVGTGKENDLSASVEIDGVHATASLSSDGVMQWVAESGGEGGKNAFFSGSSSLNVCHDCVGFTSRASTVMLHTFVLTNGTCFGGDRKRRRKDVRIDFDSSDSHGEWVTALERIISKERPKRLTVLLNPRGGKGQARSIYKKEVEPLLRAASIDINLIETKYYKHAEEIVSDLNLDETDGIACLSGDGILFEVLNGILRRADWQQAIKTPIGMIPCGSANGMAKSLSSLANEPCDPGSATFAIIQGKTKMVDIGTVRQGRRTEQHFILNMCWAMPSDTDVESERYQWMGGIRMTLQAIVRIINLRKYDGVLRYLPSKGNEGSAGRGDSSQPDHKTNLLDPYGSETGKDPNQPLDGDWQEMRGEFILFWVQNVKWAASDMMPAPSAELSDGCMDLIVLRSCSRLKMLYFLLAMEKGGHVKSDCIIYLKVRALRLEPGGRSAGKDKGEGGYVTADGEVLCRGKGTRKPAGQDAMEYGPLMDVSIRQGLATLFAAH